MSIIKLRFLRFLFSQLLLLGLGWGGGGGHKKNYVLTTNLTDSSKPLLIVFFCIRSISHILYLYSKTISITSAVYTHVECKSAKPCSGNTKVINSKGQYCNGYLHIMKEQENKWSAACSSCLAQLGGVHDLLWSWACLLCVFCFSVMCSTHVHTCSYFRTQ